MMNPMTVIVPPIIPSELAARGDLTIGNQKGTTRQYARSNVERRVVVQAAVGCLACERARGGERETASGAKNLEGILRYTSLQSFSSRRRLPYSLQSRKRIRSPASRLRSSVKSSKLITSAGVSQQSLG